MYPYLADDNSVHKKAKCVNNNVVATISRNEYNDLFLKKKCLRHSMNRIPNKNHGTRTSEISKISLSCFDDKIYIQKNGFDVLSLAYQS